MEWPFPLPLMPPVPAEEVPTEPIYRLTVEQYHKMVRAGILTKYDPVELLEGWLVRRVAKTPAHVYACGRLEDELRRMLPRGWHEAKHGPVTFGDSEPEPDLSVVRGCFRDYGERHPGPEDARLIIEVADGTLSRDQGIKKRIYARANIPVYWIVNLEEGRLEIHTAPAGSDYEVVCILGPEGLAPVTLEGRELGRIPVSDLLP